VIKMIAGINTDTIIGTLILFGIFYAIIALTKKSVKTAAEKIVEHKTTAGLYLLGIFGILTIIFAKNIANYLQIQTTTPLITFGILLVLIGFIQIWFKGGKYIVKKGLKQL